MEGSGRLAFHFDWGSGVHPTALWLYKETCLDPPVPPS